MDTTTPIFILSGFLGSGKTTLLVKLLLEIRRRGLKPGILMNELGRQDVDGILLNEETGFSMEKLLDGCVCCSKKEELGDSLLTLLGTNPDLLLIELTGVANPLEITELMAQAPFANLVSVKHSITVLDAEHALDYGSRFSADKQLVETLRSQMESADLILVNKTDLVSEAKLSKVIKLIRKHNSKAALHPTRHAEVDVNGWFADITPRSGSQNVRQSQARKQQQEEQQKPNPYKSPDTHHDQHNPVQPAFRVLQHPHEQQQHREVVRAAPDSSSSMKTGSPGSFSAVQTFTLTCTGTRTLSREELERFLTGLPGQILRAKGYIRLEGRGTSLMQYAGDRFSYETSRYPGAGYIVIIGFEVDPVKSAEQWNRLMSKDSADLPI